MPASTRSSASASELLPTNDSVWALILAGGIGSRFWPASTRARPKQLLPLASERPLIVDTVARARSLVPDDRIRILAGEHLGAPFRSVLDDFPGEGYWVEPRARGTAPVLVWAAWKAARADPEAVVVSLHADHRIETLEDFQDTVLTAIDVARRDGLLLSVAAEPDRIEPGYGHVELGEPVAEAGPAAAYHVRAFHEKPDADTAERYVREGYLWNTGIFVWKASVLLDEVERHAPEVAEYLPLLEESEAAFFDAVPVSVIDRAVMERSDRVGTVVATFEWDDVGSWEALGRTRKGDADGNVILGPGHVVDAERNIVFAEEGEVVLFGTRDLVVVRVDGKTVVMPRDRAADIKALLSALEHQGS